MCFFIQPVHAYIDPSVMTYAIQAVAGIAIALGTVVGIYWRKILKAIRRVFGIRKVKSKNQETNDLFFDDDRNQQKITPASFGAEELQYTKVRRLIVGDKTEKQDPDKSIDKGSMKTRVRCVLFDLMPGILVSMATSFMMCYYAPLEVYMNNQDEFWFDYSVLQPQVLKMMLGLFAILMLVNIAVYVLNKKVYKLLTLLEIVCFVILYIHGNFFAADLPPMDGTTIVWAEYYGKFRDSMLICLITLIVFSLCYKFLSSKKYFNVISFISVLISLMLMISLINITHKTNGKAVKQVDYIVSKNNEFNYSTQENFIIFVVDAFDSATFQSVIEEYPEYKSLFEGFTYYPDTVCAYPFTSRSIPFILSGEWFENQTNVKEYYSEAIHNSLLINSLEKKGYRLDVYEDSFFYETDYSRYSNLVETKVQVTNNHILRNNEYQLAMYKYLPYFMKEDYQVDINSFSDTMKIVDEGTQVYTINDLDYYNFQNSQGISTTDENVFKFIHIEGAHVPFDLDENMNWIDNTGTYALKIRATIKILENYLQKLKDSNVFDNSKIVIMGDHGFDELYRSLENRSNALLMVKGLNENDDFKTSELPISYDDLQGMYQNLLNGATGDTAFEGLTDDNNERRFLSHGWTNENVLTEYMQTGHATDMSTMIATGTQYITDDLSGNEGQGFAE